MKNIIILSLLFFVFSCASENKETEAEVAYDSTAADLIQVEAPLIAEFDYPIDSNYGAIVVIPQTIILKETADLMKSKDVFALFKSADGYYLDKVKIIVKDYDAENEPGVYKTINCEHKDSCLFLVAGPEYLKTGRVSAVDINDPILSVGKTIELNLNGSIQKLVATGTYREGKESDNFNDMMNYRLMLFGEKNQNEKTDMLVAHDSFDDTSIQLLFAGDIDGDGQLDYLIETSRKYTYTAPALYLSKEADAESLLKLIDVATSLGGC